MRESRQSQGIRLSVGGLRRMVRGKNLALRVVDPGVGGARPAIDSLSEADRRWYVGPGNGLFELVRRRATNTRSWEIDWQPGAPLGRLFTGAISSPRLLFHGAYGRLGGRVRLAPHRQTD